jgi:16S rRNA (guanine1207-N2)-methyltransferase
VVVMNPPFHSGRAPRPQLGAAFIRAAAALLKPSGQLLMVANRHLPYETALAETFRKVEELPGAPGFKLLLAQGPLKKAAPAPAGRTAPRGEPKRAPGTGRRG